MALKKPLVLGSDGSIEQLQSGDELDIDLSGVGGGGDTIQMVMAETVTTNSALCITASGVVKADKDDSTKVRVVGFATASGNSGNSISVRVSAQQGGFSGLTAGEPIFLDTAGTITQVVPTSGHAVRLGVALSVTDILVELSQPIKL
jgi:hypothetical protein